MNKPYFDPKFFTPSICRILTKYCAISKNQENWDIALELFVGTEPDIVQYQVFPFQNFTIFLPNKILNGKYRFGLLSEFKRRVLHIPLSEENFIKLITDLGGSARKKTKISPTIGDLLDKK